MKKVYSSVSLLLIALLLFSACSNNATNNSSQAGNSSSNTTSQAKDKTKQVLLNYGTTQSASGLYAYHVAVGNSINKYSQDHANNSVKVTVVETGGVEDNIARLIKGEVQFAVSTIPTDYQLMKGIETFEGKAMDSIRTLFVFQQNAFIPIVRVDSGVKELADLSGKPVQAGNVGSAAYGLTTKALEVAGITPEYSKGGGSDALDAMRDKDIVGMFKAGNSLLTVDSGIQELSLTTELKPLTWTDEQISKITTELPYYQFGNIQAGIYPNQPEDIKVQVFYVDVIATKDSIDEDTAYTIVKGVLENQQLQADALASFANTNYPALTMEGAIAPLHAGAVKYFKEIGVEIPEHLIPDEAK